MALLAIALFTFIHRSQVILALEQSEILASAANLMRRSLFNIIWGSLSTTFICVWVSVHPNVPQPYEGLWKRLGRRLLLMLSAVIAPEFIVSWAVRQWYVARQIREEYRDHDWTMSHAHFLDMGGFALCKSGTKIPEEPEPPRWSQFFTQKCWQDYNQKRTKYDELIKEFYRETLSAQRFRELESSGLIEFPSITKREIEDRSKGDGLSKIIAAFQTSWFVLQCIVRGAQGLAITELELVTLALASLNVVTLWFWRDKPLDVRVQVPVKLKPEFEDQIGPTESPPIKNEEQSMSRKEKAKGILSLFKESFNNFSIISRYFFPVLLDSLNYTWKNGRRGLSQWWSTINVGTLQGLRNLFFPILVIYHFFYNLILLILFPLSIFSIPFMFILLNLTTDDITCNTCTIPASAAHSRAVVLFYALKFERKKSEMTYHMVVATIVGIVFGGLHCIAWNFTYPTQAERILWRSTSVAIAIIPFFAVRGALNYVELSEEAPRERISLLSILAIALANFVSLLLILYMLARLSIITQALILLTKQPPSAYVAIDWTQYIPHAS